jgi:hypothetical protein
MVSAMETLASYSLTDLKVSIEACEIEIANLRRLTDYVSPAMADAYKRLEQLEAEKLARIGSVWRKTR